MEIVEISTGKDQCVMHITREVQRIVAASMVSSGMAVVCSLHTTAGVTVNENADPDVMTDLLGALERMVPKRGPYLHGEGNSDAHVKAALVGLSVTVPVENGELVLGTWQGIHFCEFDGPRRRRVGVQVVGK